MRQLKKPIVGLIIITLSLQMNISFINTDSSFQIEDDTPKIKNIGVPYYNYNDMIFHDSFAYLFESTNVDVMDISDLTNVNINRTYESNSWLDTYNQFHHCSYNLSHNEFYIYKFTQISTRKYLVYNKYELFNNNSCILTQETTTNITYSGGIYEVLLSQENNELQIVIAGSKFLSNIYNISLMTFDITNRSTPILEDHVLIHQEINFTIWNQLPEHIRDYEDIKISGNFLYLIRSYFTYNVTDSFESKKLEFAYGYLKVWDISNTSNPEVVNFIELEIGDFAGEIEIVDNLLFYRIIEYGVLIYNCTNPANLELLVEYKNNKSPTEYILDDDILYLICSEKIEVLDFSNPQSLKKMSQYVPHFQGNGGFYQGELRDNYLFVLRSSEFSGRNFYVFDCSNLNNIKRLYPEGFRISDEKLFNLVITATFLGPILGIVLIVLTIVIVVRKRRKKKEKKLESDE
ncbi:MAG: hypothetical protein ACTSSH_01295 [Candidatus Heimdallarchaeota archaeon]